MIYLYALHNFYINLFFVLYEFYCAFVLNSLITNVYRILTILLKKKGFFYPYILIFPYKFLI